MKSRNTFTITAIIIICLAGSALAAADFYTSEISPEKDLLVFPSSKGEVIFSHKKHLKSLRERECISCHRIDNPTLKNIQSRFEDHRIAHSFCKGCHRDMGMGPTECHQCHNYKKTI